MNDRTDAMTLATFETLLDAHGADLATWPLDRRHAARALVAREPAAKTLLDEATRLDRMLGALGAPGPSDALQARVAAMAQAQTGGHWIWVMVARPVWRPALFAAAMLGGVYLGAAALPAALATTDTAFDLATVAGGGGALGSLDLLEE